jgi:hypothetical protein
VDGRRPALSVEHMRELTGIRFREVDAAQVPLITMGMADLRLHPDELYILINDWPKVGNLKSLFPKQYRAQPVLVGGTR